MPLPDSGREWLGLLKHQRRRASSVLSLVELHLTRTFQSGACPSNRSSPRSLPSCLLSRTGAVSPATNAACRDPSNPVAQPGCLTRLAPRLELRRFQTGPADRDAAWWPLSLKGER